MPSGRHCCYRQHHGALHSIPSGVVGRTRLAARDDARGLGVAVPSLGSSHTFLQRVIDDEGDRRARRDDVDRAEKRNPVPG